MERLAKLLNKKIEHKKVIKGHRDKLTVMESEKDTLIIKLACLDASIRDIESHLQTRIKHRTVNQQRIEATKLAEQIFFEDNNNAMPEEGDW